MAEVQDPRFRNANVLRMFPSFVWKAETAPEIHRPLNDAIVRNLGAMGAPLADLAVSESWQSDPGLHALAEFRDLVELIDAAAGHLLDHLEIIRQGVQITGCWANVSAPGGRHDTHAHPNNYVSGVYYVRTQEGADTINFHDPRSQVGIIRPPVRELCAEIADLVVVKVNDGGLLLFPAWLQHSVDVNRSRNVRISVSFNLMFSAYAETMSAPSW
ncbi:MAG: 2OG-Fe(II) oxygenase family protein, partial [Alphaproteobacteria bacterium]